ncbi:MAG: DUF99 family protein [Candidatus Binatia bacterium]|nr:DUF99 family protein [Candidatus Binatia bacterium]
MRRLSNTVGFDDAPFHRRQAGRVPVVGAVFASTRLDGVLLGSVERDGDDATDVFGRLVRESRFYEHIQVVLLQGVTFAGFNVVDVPTLSSELHRPVLVVARRQPNWDKLRRALWEKVPQGRGKWQCLERLGPMEPLAGVYVQRWNLSLDEAQQLLARTTLWGRLPEPLRVAHLIAGALGRGESRGGA